MVNPRFRNGQRLESIMTSSDLGKIEQDKAYAEQYARGYSFLTNGSVKDIAPLYRAALTRAKVDFVVEKRAFTLSGKEDAGMVAFLIKEKQKQPALKALKEALEQVRHQ